MTVFTIPRGQARALFASLLPHAGRQTDDTPLFGRVRFAPGDDQLLAWTTDAVTAAVARVDVIEHLDGELELFDLGVSAVKAALAVFKGPSGSDAGKSMWDEAPLRVEVRDADVVLEEVEELLLDGRSLTVERWVTEGEDRYPDVPRTIAGTRTSPDPNAAAMVAADSLARFTPSAKAWGGRMQLALTADPHRVEVRIGARLLGICPGTAPTPDERQRAATVARDWTELLTPHIRLVPPAGLTLADLEVEVDALDPRPHVAADALSDDPDAEEDEP